MKTFRTTGTGSEQTLSEIETDKIPLYPTEQDLLDDLANLEVGQIAGTVDPAESELIGVLIQKIQELENAQMPDWNNVQSITNIPYTVPSDGWIVGYIPPSTSPANYVVFKINNVEVAKGDYTTVWRYNANIQMKVNKGDVITVDGAYADISALSFIPHK